MPGMMGLPGFLGVFLAATSAGAGEGVEGKVDALFEAMAGKNRPGAAVLVASDGRVLLSRAMALPT